MPRLDILDAFAELVVCVVFNLPHDEGYSSSVSSSAYSDDENTSSAGSTQIFSRVNSIGDASLPLSLSSNAPSHSPDLYPGGIWSAQSRVPVANMSRPSSINSMTTCELSTPGSCPDHTMVPFWSRVLGGTVNPQTASPPLSSTTLQTTFTSTATSSFVQLTEEDMAAGLCVGAMEGSWSGQSTPMHGIDRPSGVHGNRNCSGNTTACGRMSASMVVPSKTSSFSEFILI